MNRQVNTAGRSTRRNRSRESGTALLIALFALLLVGVVAIALIVNSGTESALSGNYRTATTAYYAALAGLEEARGRLYPRNPNFLNGLPSPLPVNRVVYIRNPAGAEAVNPTDLSAGNAYADREYASEFPAVNPNITYFNSDSGASGIPGPLYKWVRVTAATEQSLGRDVNSDAQIDQNTLVYFDPGHVDGSGNPQPSLILGPTATAVQALQVTALAVLPSGSQKMLQYVVAPSKLLYSPLAAVTLSGSPGNNPTFVGPDTGDFLVNGNDQFPAGTCNPGAGKIYALGYSSGSTFSPSIPPVRKGNYEGLGAPPNPSAGALVLPPTYNQPRNLESYIQGMDFDVVLNPPGPQPPGTLYTFSPADLPATSYGQPQTILVNGNLNLSGSSMDGYGFLVVTGQLTYDPNVNWFGVIFVVGQGVWVSSDSGTGLNQGKIWGAVLVAQTRDVIGNLLATFGPASFSEPGPGPSPSEGFGVYYSSCWVNYVQQGVQGYKTLSFREISQ